VCWTLARCCEIETSQDVDVTFVIHLLSVSFLAASFYVTAACVRRIRSEVVYLRLHLWYHRFWIRCEDSLCHGPSRYTVFHRRCYSPKIGEWYMSCNESVVCDDCRPVGLPNEVYNKWNKWSLSLTGHRFDGPNRSLLHWLDGNQCYALMSGS
jgi:hypothetical protein